ncbi:MAG TPA: peroxiredoxin-like family protein [Oceanipulchritudo sp.]|nr:peroxiredoxin-like family protein [Oceanipulchritudo sp.]
MKPIPAILTLLLSASILGALPQEAKKVSPIGVGESIPPVTVQTIDGESRNLASLSAGKPCVLIFYRGSWCPYCNRHLSALAGIEDDLEDLGYRILAVSPDRPAGLKEAVAENKLGYTLLSDSSAEAIKAFGLAFEVDEKTRKMYARHGIDLNKASGEEHYMLPVPAVYLVDKEGRIQFHYSNPDHSVRLSAKDLIKAARDQLTP